jgi:hypothetical protein
MGFKKTLEKDEVPKTLLARHELVDRYIAENGG